MMRFTASSTARLGDTATLVATRRGLVCWSNARPRGRRKRAATRPQAFFDAGTASAPGNNDSGNNGGGDEPPQQRRSLQSLIELLLSVQSRAHLARIMRNIRSTPEVNKVLRVK